MRISNKIKNGPFSSNFLSLVISILSLLTIVTSSPASSSPLLSTAMPPSLSPMAFAFPEGDYQAGIGGIGDVARGTNNNNQAGGEGYSGLISNLISQQQNPQVYARNVNADNKVIIVEDCEDGDVIINDNDQIIQTNTQSFNQEANNHVDEEKEEEGEEEDS